MGTTADIDAFIEHWRHTGGSELANTQSFISGLCHLLGVEPPHGSKADDSGNDYVFERRVFQDNGDGTQSFGRIDCYKRDCFILEAKQGSEGDRAAAGRGEDDLDLFGQTASARLKLGTAKRGTPAWAKAMVQAKGQAERYAKALPVDHGWPPFLLVADIGYCIEVYADFTGTGIPALIERSEEGFTNRRRSTSPWVTREHELSVMEVRKWLEGGRQDTLRCPIHPKEIGNSAPTIAVRLGYRELTSTSRAGKTSNIAMLFKDGLKASKTRLLAHRIVHADFPRPALACGTKQSVEMNFDAQHMLPLCAASILIVATINKASNRLLRCACPFPAQSPQQALIVARQRSRVTHTLQKIAHEGLSHLRIGRVHPIAPTKSCNSDRR